ncbi:MAG: VOC family protein [Acidimicrobiales bacterium]
MHRILMRTIVFDFPSDVHEAARDFWQVALLADIRRGTKYPEYHVLQHPAALGSVMVQHLQEGTSHIHVDIETDDLEAEISRLVEAGAEIVQRHEQWTVLRDPGGLLFCVVPAGSPDFEELARTTS